MKKIIICLLFSATIGILLGLYSFRLLNKDISVTSINNVYAIQVGAFDEISNANKLASKYGAIVVSESNKYRVYVAIVSDKLNEVEKYFDDLGIPYYVRGISVSNSFYEFLKEYEKNIDNNTEDTIKNILKKYMEEI